MRKVDLGSEAGGFTPIAKRKTLSIAVGLALLSAGLLACGGHGGSPEDPDAYTPHFTNTAPVQYSLGPGASGVSEVVNNIANLTVVSNDANDLKAEYQAGFVQGHLEGTAIRSARDNALEFWGLPTSEMAAVNSLLTANYDFMIDYLQTNAGTVAGHQLTRLLFRMLGIYHGATLSQPQELDFSGTWLPASSTFQASELVLGYQTTALTFIDLYFVNAQMDVTDAYYSGTGSLKSTPKHLRKYDVLSCSAFVKRTADDVIIAHTSWTSFLAQTKSLTVAVNGDMVTLNAITPGQISSGMDFGYNNKGMMFNETTHAYNYTAAKTNAIWIFWRAALAEQFSGSIDEFFEDISLDNSGTYLNGYMLVDAKTQETGLIDMSYQTFVLFRSTGGPYTYTTKPAGLTTDYDAVMLTPEYIMGYNYPVSLLVRSELQSSYDSPHRGQLQQLLPGVTDLNSARTVITYHDPAVPGSIFGRFDKTAHPSPSGSIDAKVANAGMARAFMQLSGTIDMSVTANGYWMLFGTAHLDGVPFIWSRSPWSGWSHPDVPDAVDGTFTLLNFHMK